MNQVKEIFGFGTRFGIKEILTIGDHEQHFVFNPLSRVDGLVKREEVQLYFLHSKLFSACFE